MSHLLPHTINSWRAEARVSLKNNSNIDHVPNHWVPKATWISPSHLPLHPRTSNRWEQENSLLSASWFCPFPPIHNESFHSSYSDKKIGMQVQTDRLKLKGPAVALLRDDSVKGADEEVEPLGDRVWLLITKSNMWQCWPFGILLESLRHSSVGFTFNFSI